MEYFTILKSQANTLYKRIQAFGFSPSEFKWETDYNPDDEREKASKLVLIGSDFYFLFHSPTHIKYYPDADSLVDSRRLLNWEDTLLSFSEWLRLVDIEINSADFWSAIEKESKLQVATTSKDDNAKFNNEELGKLQDGIDELKGYLIEAQKIDKEIVEPRLKYLVESSKRNGRKDWLNIFYSVIIGIILNSYVTPESSREIMGFIGATFDVLFNNPTPLLEK